jgi:hypothetical protein
MRHKRNRRLEKRWLKRAKRGPLRDYLEPRSKKAAAKERRTFGYLLSPEDRKAFSTWGGKNGRVRRSGNGGLPGFSASAVKYLKTKAGRREAPALARDVAKMERMMARGKDVSGYWKGSGRPKMRRNPFEENMTQHVHVSRATGMEPMPYWRLDGGETDCPPAFGRVGLSRVCAPKKSKRGVREEIWTEDWASRDTGLTPNGRYLGRVPSRGPNVGAWGGGGRKRLRRCKPGYAPDDTGRCVPDDRLFGIDSRGSRGGQSFVRVPMGRSCPKGYARVRGQRMCVKKKGLRRNGPSDPPPFDPRKEHVLSDWEKQVRSGKAFDPYAEMIPPKSDRFPRIKREERDYEPNRRSRRSVSSREFNRRSKAQSREPRLSCGHHWSGDECDVGCSARSSRRSGRKQGHPAGVIVSIRGPNAKRSARKLMNALRKEPWMGGPPRKNKPYHLTRKGKRAARRRSRR